MTQYTEIRATESGKLFVYQTGDRLGFFADGPIELWLPGQITSDPDGIKVRVVAVSQEVRS